MPVLVQCTEKQHLQFLQLRCFDSKSLGIERSQSQGPSSFCSHQFCIAQSAYSLFSPEAMAKKTAIGIAAGTFSGAEFRV